MTARALFAVLLLFAAPASAELVRIEVKSRADVLAGQAFGAAGPYEKLAGTLHFAVDPRKPANRIITDLDKAPRNTQGLVEFSSDFYLIRPRDPARGNGTLLYEVSNRGGKSMLGFFNFAAGGLDPTSAIEYGDASNPRVVHQREGRRSAQPRIRRGGHPPPCARTRRDRRGRPDHRHRRRSGRHVRHTVSRAQHQTRGRQVRPRQPHEPQLAAADRRRAHRGAAQDRARHCVSRSSDIRGEHSKSGAPALRTPGEGRKFPR
jgi:hypothetical protein